ncbi:uncharacterized protein [Argopecten irradians]|uniref:uncharacterized protein n=1 Tax=Argopecten irradians TaxID=31199 RepID=UPI003712A4FB
MDAISHLMLAVCCCLFVLSVEEVDALKFRPKLTAGASRPNGLSFTPTRERMGGFGGFGMDAMCALCIRLGDYQCYLRYCTGGSFRGMGGFAGRGGIAGRGGFAGRGGVPLPAPFVPWNPSCAACQTDSCRRLWCASGLGGFTAGAAGRGGAFGPYSYYRTPSVYNTANRYTASISYNKPFNYGRSYKK